MPSPPEKFPRSFQFWEVSHWATFVQYLMEGPILNLTDFHLVGVLGRLVVRGSEDNSETPPLSVADADVVVAGNTPAIATISDNNIFRILRMGVAPFVWV